MVVHEEYAGAVLLEPHEDFGPCLIGSVDDPVRLAYSYEKIVEMFMNRDGMSYEEATEFVDYNTVRALAYMGEQKPVMVYGLLEA